MTKFNLGFGTTSPSPADYDGDGSVDPSVYILNAQWSSLVLSLCLQSTTGTSSPLVSRRPGDQEFIDFMRVEAGQVDVIAREEAAGAGNFGHGSEGPRPSA